MSEFQSLSAVVDLVNESDFYTQSLEPDVKFQISSWIANRSGQGHAYGPLPGLTVEDRLMGIRLFTGEKIIYSASSRHVMGEEALRSLIVLDQKDNPVSEIIRNCESWMSKRLLESKDPGVY